MKYLNYEEYKSLGGLCDKKAFERNIHRACSVIDNVTFNRVAYMAKVPSAVKVCCRDLVEYYETYANLSEKNAVSRSQSAGAVSESVSYEKKTDDDIKSDIDSIIYDYLMSVKDDSGVMLLYKGAME